MGLVSISSCRGTDTDTHTHKKAGVRAFIRVFEGRDEQKSRQLRLGTNYYIHIALHMVSVDTVCYHLSYCATPFLQILAWSKNKHKAPEH